MVCRLVNPTIFRLYVSQNSDLNKTKSEIGPSLARKRSYNKADFLHTCSFRSCDKIFLNSKKAESYLNPVKNGTNCCKVRHTFWSKRRRYKRKKVPIIIAKKNLLQLHIIPAVRNNHNALPIKSRICLWKIRLIMNRLRCF